MTPDTKMASNNNVRSGTSRRHKSGSRHRGKTAKSKKKRSWALFSPWEGDDVSDDEKDFLHFCKSRGLVRASTAPSFQKQSSCPNLDARQDSRPLRRSTATSSVACARQPRVEVSSMSDMAKLVNEENKYIAMLCSSLTDKLKFIKDSENCPPTPPTPAADTREMELTHNPQPSKIAQAPLSTHQAELVKPAFIEANKSKESDSSSTTSSARTGKFPKISMRNEREPASCTSPVSSTSTQKLVSISTNDVKRSAVRRVTREWTAEVENEIMRLYENGAPGTGLVDVKPQPRPISNVREQVESKLSNADHTPSYVLALANLFRRRMQIRKEFKQVAGEMIDTSVRGSSVPYLANNSFPPQSPKSGHPKSVQIFSSDAPQPVAFRYHHVTSESTPTLDSSAGCSPPSIPKFPSVAFCSISSPLVSAIAENAHSSSQEIKDEPRHEITSHDTNARNELNSGKIALKPSVVNHVTSSDKNRQAQTNTLTNLLTVFPKPPQFKFSGIQTLPGSNDAAKERNKLKTENGVVKAKGKPGKMSPRDVVILSMQANLKRDYQKTLKTVEQLQSLNKDAVITRQTAPNGKRTSQSASAPHVRIGSTVGSHTMHKHFSNSLKSFEASPPQREHDIFIPQNKHLTDDVDFAIVPMTKVRWSGSLGTLYAKPKQPDKGNTVRGIHQSEVGDLLSSSGSKHDSNDRLETSNLMTISPIEKHKGAVVS